METSLAQRAIEAALARNWDEAAKINLQIVKSDKEDIEAFNRLSKAYSELGEIQKARDAAKKALKLDPVNPIAQKSLKKLQTLKRSEKPFVEGITLESFLEEPGKTRLIGLIHPGDVEILSGLSAGDIVTLLPHPHRVSAVTSDGKYIGRLPDDLAARLRRLINIGFKYQALVKSVEGRSVSVFVREIERGKEGNGLISFPPEKIDYVSFTPPELVHKETPEVPMTEENF